MAKTEEAVKVSNRWTRTGITAICCKLPDRCSFPGTQMLFVSERAGVGAGSLLLCWGSTCPSLCFGARHWEEKSRSFPGSNHSYHSLEQKAQCCLLASSYPDLPGCTESILISSDTRKFTNFVLHFHPDLHSANYSRLHLHLVCLLSAIAKLLKTACEQKLQNSPPNF